MKQINKSTRVLRGAVIGLSIVLVLLIAVLLWMDRNGPGYGSETGAGQTTQTPEETTKTAPPINVPQESGPVYEDVEVQAAYCKLFYSGQWADSIRTERITEDFVETIRFYGTAEGKETLLFAIYFADATDNSFPVGVYSTADALTVDISAEIFELEEDGWTDRGYDQICEMQEQVNHVLEKLDETEGFTPAQ